MKAYTSTLGLLTHSLTVRIMLLCLVTGFRACYLFIWKRHNIIFDISVNPNLISLFLGAKAPLQPTSSEGLSVCNILTPLPSPREKRQRDKETKRQRDKETKRQMTKMTKNVKKWQKITKNDKNDKNDKRALCEQSVSEWVDQG